MLAGKKLFPYPTLNSNEGLSGYIHSKFKLEFKVDDIVKSKEFLTLKNIYFSISNKAIQELLDNKLAKCVLIVDCSSSVFRESYELSQNPEDIKIELSKLKGLVYITSFIYLTNNINKFRSDEFDEDYIEYEFDLEKFDIIAIDDGFRFITEISESEDNKLSSIFTIVKKDENNNLVSYGNTNYKIVIELAPIYYDSYCKMKNEPQFNNIFFSMIVIPVLSNCIKEIQVDAQEETDIEDLIITKRWLKAVRNSYKTEIGRDLSLGVLKETNCLELAQIVLNKGTCTGLLDFENIIMNGLVKMDGGEIDE